MDNNILKTQRIIRFRLTKLDFYWLCMVEYNNRNQIEIQLGFNWDRLQGEKNKRASGQGWGQWIWCKSLGFHVSLRSLFLPLFIVTSSPRLPLTVPRSPGSRVDYFQLVSFPIMDRVQWNDQAHFHSLIDSSPIIDWPISGLTIVPQPSFFWFR